MSAAVGKEAVVISFYVLTSPNKFQLLKPPWLALEEGEEARGKYRYKVELMIPQPGKRTKLALS